MEHFGAGVQIGSVESTDMLPTVLWAFSVAQPGKMRCGSTYPLAMSTLAVFAKEAKHTVGVKHDLVSLEQVTMEQLVNFALYQLS
jgi:hypothetical protein